MADPPVPEDLGEVVLTPRHLADLREVYDNTGETRNTDILIQWAISAVMFTLNAALLPFGLDRVSKADPLGILIGTMVFVIASFWFVLEMRMEWLIQYWNKKLIDIEDILQPPIRVFGGEEFFVTVKDVRIRTHHVVIVMIMLFGVFGLFTAVGSYFSFTQPSAPRALPAVIEKKMEEGFQQLDKRMEEFQEQLQVHSQQVQIPKPVPATKRTQPKRGERK